MAFGVEKGRTVDVNESITDDLEVPLTLRVPRNAFTFVAPPPATVTQHTAECHFGIPPNAFKAMARDGLFPTRRIGRLIVAAYKDVKRAVTEGATAQEKLRRASKAVRTDEKLVPISTEAAETDVESSRTPREFRERKREITEGAWDLVRAFEPKLEDGSPNPFPS